MASLVTVTVPSYVPAEVGAKVSVVVPDPPAATVPLVALAVTTAFPVLSPLHLNLLSPVLLMVSVLDVLAPTSTSPNARLPDSPRMRVESTGAADPIPESVIASLSTLVASLVIIITLKELPAAAGVYVAVTAIDAPAATVPLVGLTVNTGCPGSMSVTVSVLFPVLVMLNVVD